MEQKDRLIAFYRVKHGEEIVDEIAMFVSLNHLSAKHITLPWTDYIFFDTKFGEFCVVKDRTDHLVYRVSADVETLKKYLDYLNAGRNKSGDN